MNEAGLGEIELAGNRLHLCVTERGCGEHDGQLIAGVFLIRKDVDDVERVGQRDNRLMV